jgi:putative transposase
MPNYHRWYHAGGTFFFTAVTYGRQPLFQDPVARDLLGTIFRAVASELPFKTLAIVLLWDHLHCVWSLPSGDDGYPTRWKEIKSRFTRDWVENGGLEERVTASQQAHGHRGVWQRRYWEHRVRDEVELSDICDYIHYNPVKHEYVGQPVDWPWSSFHRFVREGHYPPEWGRTLPDRIRAMEWD